jgi:SAM-dependent methyltransferase
MGVFTKELKVAAQMWDKFQQIDRFLELLADETDKLKPETVLNIIDFGCGKSYLTFLIYDYFSRKKSFRTNIHGLDSNTEIVKKCTDAAKKYGYDSLTFSEGDIASQTAPTLANWGAANTFNIVVSLHACDTATDYALFNAIRWNADLICAVPCCQHELRSQMNPQTLKIFAEYGIIKERIASLATDAIRAKLLEIHGYKAQIIEFTALEHTAKNLLIRARKTTQKKSSDELQNILQEFSFEPMLQKLLSNGWQL